MQNEIFWERKNAVHVCVCVCVCAHLGWLDVEIIR